MCGHMRSTALLWTAQRKPRPQYQQGGRRKAEQPRQCKQSWLSSSARRHTFVWRTQCVFLGRRCQRTHRGGPSHQITPLRGFIYTRQCHDCSCPARVCERLGTRVPSFPAVRPAATTRGPGKSHYHDSRTKCVRLCEFMPRREAQTRGTGTSGVRAAHEHFWVATLPMSCR